MKDFSNYSDRQLDQVLRFTTAVADKMEQERTPNFSEMQATAEALDAVEAEARQYAERRKSGLTARSTFGTTDSEEVDEIRKGIQDYYRRTRKIVKG
jgi:hypothetical protein